MQINHVAVAVSLVLMGLMGACGGGGNGGGGPPVAELLMPKFWRTAAPIENDNAGDALAPQIAMNAAGDAWAVWQQFDGTRTNIWANRYTRGGGWGTAALIETDNVGDARTPQIAVDGAGNAVAIWSQFDGTRFHILANRFTGGGWATAAPIETNTLGDATAPQIALDSAGTVFAVWVQADGTRTDIWANRYSAGNWGTAVRVETDDAGSALAPQIAIDSAGNATAIWSQSDGTRTDIWTNRYSAGNWGTAVRIETDNGPAYEPQIAVDSAGNALAVWSQFDGARENVWANRYTGGSWGTATRIETDDTGDANFAQIAVDSAGNAWAVWRQFDGVRDNIWANRFSIGTGWGTATPIEADNLGGGDRPQIAIDSAGSAIAVWHQSDGTRHNIWTNRYHEGSWGAATLLETETGDARFPQIAFDNNGYAFAVWSQFDGARYNVWVNRYE